MTDAVLVEGTARAMLGGLSFFGVLVGPYLSAAQALGTIDGAVTPEMLIGAAVDRLTGTAGLPIRAASATTPGQVRRVDVNRVFTYARDVLRGGLVDLQAKTLDAPFIADAEALLKEAALAKWGRARFAEEMDSLAESWGATNYRSSYANTWYDTIILNSSYNKSLRVAYAAEPTKRLFPFLAYRTVGDTRVRPEHAALDGFVARVDWDGWDRYTPPLGWNCRCRIVPVAYAIARELGWLGEEFPRGTTFLLPLVVGEKIVIPGRSPGFSPVL